ncbi:helix-turn-helix domain-containing protein [Lysinibacillus irui]|uniref:helix-turn-helix domain-containing protein n=1 Tax=Lysinibacillus irui TaxID=2998077 RepID=UPI00404401B8
MFTGEEIRQRRKSRGLSTSELSKLSGVSQPYISQIENGDRVASVKTLNKLVEALGVSKLYSLREQGYLDETDILALLDENKRLREALKFYADKTTYENAIDINFGGRRIYAIDNDEGERARIALKGDQITFKKNKSNMACAVTDEVSDDNFEVLGGKLVLSIEGAKKLIDEIELK